MGHGSSTVVIYILAIVPAFLGQRPSFAGIRPIGYPEIPTDYTALQNKFGDERLPPQLNGDLVTANRIDSLPLQQQPIWWINRKEYLDYLNNPQTYPQRPSIFNENRP